MSEKILNGISEKLNSIESTLNSRLGLIDVRLSSLEARISRIEDDMRKVLKCVDHENADFDPLNGVHGKRKEKAKA